VSVVTPDDLASMRGVAQAYLSGEIGAIEASRTMSRLGAGLLIFGSDPILADICRVFVGIDDVTDALPLGDVRKLWNENALIEEDAKIARAEEQHAEKMKDACRRLLEARHANEIGLC
jgi:hypothetical protein